MPVRKGIDMVLYRHEMEKFCTRERDMKDRRKFVARAVFSYFDRETGHEYRKSFTAPAGTPEMKFWDIAPKTINQESK